jgi:large subunit ribosomal protein L4
MKKVDIYNLEGKKIADMELSEKVFGFAKNDALVHQVYVAQAANRRSGNAHTKIRSEVSGGGKKPWKQKGTGNARTGSIRNPIWRGGGIIFGPLKEKNYTKGINAKMKQKALLTVLSQKAEMGKIRVIDSLQMDEPKTKKVVTMLKNIGIDKSVLFGLSKGESDSYKAVRNIAKTNVIETTKFNVYELLNTEYVVLSKESLQQLDNQYAQ